MLPSEVSAARRASLATVALMLGASGVVLSGYVHYYLYFEGGYRGIQPENVLGLTVSRAFILNAIAALVVAEGIVLALRWPRLLAPAATVGIVFAGASLVAYVLTRTRGFLGFSDPNASNEAVLAVAAESLTVVVLAAAIALDWRRDRSVTDAPTVEPCGGAPSSPSSRLRS